MWIVADSHRNMFLADIKRLVGMILGAHMFTHWKKVPYKAKVIVERVYFLGMSIVTSERERVLCV